MKINMLTYFIFQLNATVDSGKFHDITIKEVEQHIERGDLFPFLKKRVPGMDLSLMEPATIAEITKKLQELLGGYQGQERRKWGIEKNGLCLLVSWAAELIQQQVREESSTL